MLYSENNVEKFVSPNIYIHPSRDHSGWLNRRMKVYGSDESRTPSVVVKILDSDHCTIHLDRVLSRSPVHPPTCQLHLYQNVPLDEPSWEFLVLKNKMHSPRSQPRSKVKFWPFRSKVKYMHVGYLRKAGEPWSTELKTVSDLKQYWPSYGPWNITPLI